MNFNEWLNSIKCPNWAYSKCEVDTHSVIRLSYGHMCVVVLVQCVSACVDIQKSFVYIFNTDFDFGWMYILLWFVIFGSLFTPAKNKTKNDKHMRKQALSISTNVLTIVANDRRRERQRKKNINWNSLDSIDNERRAVFRAFSSCLFIVSECDHGKFGVNGAKQLCVAVAVLLLILLKVHWIQPFHDYCCKLDCGATGSGVCVRVYACAIELQSMS